MVDPSLKAFAWWIDEYNMTWVDFGSNVRGKLPGSFAVTPKFERTSAVWSDIFRIFMVSAFRA